MKKRVIILGSTGSIGRNTLAVLDGMRGEWDIVGLAAGSQWEPLAEQIERYRPEAVAISDEVHAGLLADRIGSDFEVFSGGDALSRLVEAVSCDCVVVAVVGSQGLAATLSAAKLGRRIALANKETLVVAGSLVLEAAASTGAELIPIDSEHSAVFQALHAGTRKELRTVYLTASGGPFRTLDASEMDAITIDEALEHPTWDMGPKITIDSATMMNKALEVVEARWLFDLEPDQIKVVIHPESVIHSIVEFCDGSMIAQLGAPDMRTPIQYALTYPARLPCPSTRLDLSQACQLNLHPPDEARFPALRLGYEAASRGGTAGAVLNAANEVAVELFRKKLIGFRDIARYAEAALSQHEFKKEPTLDDLLAADRWARQEVNRCSAC